MNEFYIRELQWPMDKQKISELNLEMKQYWYAIQDPKEMVWIGDDKEFQRFWFFCYLLPLRIKRLLYKLKFW